MGQSLPGPLTEKEKEAGTKDGNRFAVSAIQGWRVSMEDAHCLGQPFSEFHKDWLYFAVFDGHAGKSSSAFCANNLLAKIREKFAVYESESKVPTASNEFVGLLPEVPIEINILAAAVHDAFIELDDLMKKGVGFEDEGVSSGTTALVLIVTSTYLIYANCGDSRAILCRGGQLEFSTKDHKPGNEAEKARIQKAGCSVYIDRVNGNLAVSRAIGDFGFKSNSSLSTVEQAVSPEPTITIIPRKNDDQFTVLACDGIWDVLPNEDVCSLLLNFMTFTDSVQDLANYLVDASLFLDSRDNMTALVLVFPGAPETDESAASKNLALEELIIREVENILAAEPGEVYAYPLVKRVQQNLNITNNAIFYSKINFIIELLNQARPDRDKTKDYSSPCLQSSANSQLLLQQVAARYGACFLNSEE